MTRQGHRTPLKPVRVSPGAILREARHKAEMSIETLGEKMGLSTVFLSDVERGRRALPFERWTKLFESLPVDPFNFAEASLEMERVRIDARSMLARDRRAIARILAAYTQNIVEGTRPC